MSKRFTRDGFTVQVTNSAISIGRENTPNDLMFELSHAEAEGLIRALGVVASTEELPAVPDEISFSPFVFHSLDKGFELFRNDVPYLHPLSFEYKEIDDIQKLIKEGVGIIVNKTNYTNTRPRY